MMEDKDINKLFEDWDDDESNDSPLIGKTFTFSIYSDKFLITDVKDSKIFYKFYNITSTVDDWMWIERFDSYIKDGFYRIIN